MTRITYFIIGIIAIMLLSYGDSGIEYHTLKKKNFKVKMSPEVKKVTNNISRAFATETALCLSYKKSGDGIIIDDYRIPHIVLSGKTEVYSERCSDKYPISWHNHPPRLIDNFVLKMWWETNTGTRIQNREDLIYLSNADIDYVLNGETEYTIVSSGADNWAWWSRAQVADFADSAYVLPFDNQHYFKK